MTYPTTQGLLVLADNAHDVSARRYFLFQQAWADEVGIGSSLYATDGHLARLGLFLQQGEQQAAKDEYNHLVLLFSNLTSTSPTDYLAAVLAPLVLSLGGALCVDESREGLRRVAARVAALLSRDELSAAVESVKKNFRPALP